VQQSHDECRRECVTGPNRIDHLHRLRQLF
jgi:hypothetical protein